MELEIRKLSPELTEDYINFFENIAFTDHPEWSQCYCLHFHWESAWDVESKNSDWPDKRREHLLEMIASQKLQGYLAYSSNQVAGWCNTNDKANYTGLRRRNELWDELEENKKIKSVVCFLVAPKMRGKGIATQLLEHICQDAAFDGYEYIEAYPPKGAFDMYAAHQGTITLFEKCNFVIHKTFQNDVIMRKHL